jgi:DNA-directed RNA polymerase subunit omega
VPAHYLHAEELLERVDSSSRWSRSPGDARRGDNDYYSQLGEGLGKIVPPQVTSVSRQALSIAMEIGSA